MRNACLAALLLVPAPTLAADKPDPSADLFKPVGPVPVFKIEVDKATADSLRREPRKYVKCTLKVGDQTFKDVGIHIKGAAGSTRPWDDKPALTLNMDKFARGQSFRGLDKFHLNNSVQDGTYFNEIVCSEMSLAAGLPTPRATHALVELNGRKVGLYVLKEGFDRVFLARHFADPTGNLYDGGFLTDIDQPLRLDRGKGTGHKDHQVIAAAIAGTTVASAFVWKERMDLKALVAACREPNAEKRFAALDKVLDIDRMATNAALQVIATDWDGYCRNRNNYRVYFDPKSHKAVFFPHGMDQMFGSPHESIWPGWGGLACRAVLDTPEGKKRYTARLKEMTEKQFDIAKVLKRIDELVPRAREAMESVNKGSGKAWEQNEVKGLKDRLKQRSEYLKKEVAKLK
jgi:spore coat protein CotH